MGKRLISAIILLLTGCSAPQPPKPSGNKMAINLEKMPSAIISSKPDPIWKVSKGSTLKSSLMHWTKHPASQCAPSPTGHWNVNWNTNGINYPIDAELVFKGSFQQAITELFELYKYAEKPLYVSGYEHQCLIVISDNPLTSR